MTSRTPGGRFIHWATRTHRERGSRWGLRFYLFFLCPTLVSCCSFHLYHFIAELKNSPSYVSLSFTTTTSTLLFLAACRTRVIHELSLMVSLSMSSCGSMDRAGGHEFYCRCPTLVSCWLFHLYQQIYFSSVKVKNTNNDHKIVPKRMGQSKKFGHFKRSSQCPWYWNLSHVSS